MESHWLMWGFFTFIMVPGCVTEICDYEPPVLRNATFKVSTYKSGTLLNCQCKIGFRRIGKTYTRCVGNSTLSWENKCQCVSSSPRNTKKQDISNPEEQNERKTTEMQSHMQLTDQVNVPGHCGEPPPWEHEAPKRIYHFVVGQTVYYQCAQGFRASHRSQAKSVCLETCGMTKWTEPKLTCIRESKDNLFPDDEEPQVTTEDTPKMKITCPLSMTDITDFQKHTDVATTMETFIYTTEYQLAVAGCILLLISILFLSGLTWQWRWRKIRRSI